MSGNERPFWIAEYRADGGRVHTDTIRSASRTSASGVARRNVPEGFRYHGVRPMPAQSTVADGKTPDVYGRVWPKGTEACPTCGQPDNCGDCTHGRLTNDDVKQLGALA